MLEDNNFDIKFKTFYMLVTYAVQVRPSSPSNSRPEMPILKQEVALTNKETSKIMPLKRVSSRHENVTVNSNCLATNNNKSKSNLVETILWTSLPANLVKPGKVRSLISLVISSYFT